MRNLVIVAGLVGLATLAAPSAKGGAILVGQCIENAPCWSGETPWSDTLTLSQLTSFGLGSTVPLVAAETSEYVMQLGVTTLTFTTTTGPVVETLGQFTGTGGYNDPCNFCEIDTVGNFTIPDNATGATISGTFGNSVAPSSAGMNVCLGTGAPCGPDSSVPEPATIALTGMPLAGILALVRMRSAKRNARASN